MNETNPYQSPETSGAPLPSRPRPKIRYYASGGFFIGVALGGTYTLLSLVVDPPVLLSDVVEVITKALVVCASVGLIVGLLWGLFRVMHAPPSE